MNSNPHQRVISMNGAYVSADRIGDVTCDFMERIEIRHDGGV